VDKLYTPDRFPYHKNCEYIFTTFGIYKHLSCLPMILLPISTAFVDTQNVCD